MQNSYGAQAVLLILLLHDCLAVIYLPITEVIRYGQDSLRYGKSGNIAPFLGKGVLAMARTVRVKICGITSAADAQVAAGAGAEALGIVFYPPSPRYVADLAVAREIALAAGPFVTVVGLFVNAEPRDVEQILQAVPLNLLQFHGYESPQTCERYNRPYIKALRMKPGVDIAGLANEYVGARGILLDAYRKGVPGGTGETFDWDGIPSGIAKPLILAGGLDPNNVASAVNRVAPWAVDVSGGLEASPGVKDSNLIKQFMANVAN